MDTLNTQIEFEFPLKEDVIERDDIIYVPNSEEADPYLGYRCGGWATVQAIQLGPNKERYVTVGEYCGYFVYEWDNFLKPLQKELRDQFGMDRAWLKNPK